MRPSSQFWENASAQEKIRMLTDCYVAGSKQEEANEETKLTVQQNMACMEDAILRFLK